MERLEKHPVLAGILAAGALVTAVGVLVRPFGTASEGIALALGLGILIAVSLVQARNRRTSEGEYRFSSLVRRALAGGAAVVLLGATGVSALLVLDVEDDTAVADDSRPSDPTRTSRPRSREPARIVDVRVGRLGGAASGVGVDIQLAGSADQVLVNRLDMMQVLVDDPGPGADLPPGVGACGGADVGERIRLISRDALVVAADGEIVVGEQRSTQSNTLVSVKGWRGQERCWVASALRFRPQLPMAANEASKLLLEIPGRLTVSAAHVHGPVTDAVPVDAALTDPPPHVSQQAMAYWRSIVPGRHFDDLFIWPHQTSRFHAVTETWEAVLVLALSTAEGQCLLYGIDQRRDDEPLAPDGVKLVISQNVPLSQRFPDSCLE